MSRSRIVILVAVLCLVEPARAATINNDDSCDITVAPAATLLLPFFDVDVTRPGGATTLFTITNVTSAPQIAHVTIWTDWAYPLLTFNLFLSGYDVQSVNLYDVIARGVIAPGGQTIASPRIIAGPGSQPGLDESNPNVFDGACAGKTLKPEVVAAIQLALTVGLYNLAGTAVCGTSRIGGTHTNARGYATIDVVANCTDLFPSNPTYYSRQILFDNALIGDYQQVYGDSLAGSFAHANPMVHIRAVPEGGPPGYVPDGPTRLPYTFYDRYTPAASRKMDRRVPLPSLFAVRWVDAGSSMSTAYKIWREGHDTSADAANCSRAFQNIDIPIFEVIRFDERENSVAMKGSLRCGAICGIYLPATSTAMFLSSSLSSFFAYNLTMDAGGWLYLNLNDSSVRGRSRPSQNWVTAVMFAQGRYSVEFDAAHHGNGCTPAAPVPSPEIGPAR